VYHLFKGGSDFHGLSLVGGAAIHVMHLNDYPGAIPRETIADRDRVYPGDGVAPLADIIGQLRANGFQGVFSLELFNPAYWEQPVEQVLATGLAKMQAAVPA
jgi:sugar phosphate isomerase/epimerase